MNEIEVTTHRSRHILKNINKEKDRPLKIDEEKR
jgi:hypothetical protein